MCRRPPGQPSFDPIGILATLGPGFLPKHPRKVTCCSYAVGLAARECFFSNLPESEHHMPFLPFLGITFASIALTKFGAMSVTIAVMQNFIVLLLIVIVGLIGGIALRYLKKP